MKQPLETPAEAAAAERAGAAAEEAVQAVARVSLGWHSQGDA